MCPEDLEHFIEILLRVCGRLLCLHISFKAFWENSGARGEALVGSKDNAGLFVGLGSKEHRF